MDIVIVTLVLSAFALIGLLLDTSLREEYKLKVFLKAGDIARSGNNPVSFAFYGFICATSMLLTFFIIYLNGMYEVVFGDEELATIGLKSSGPIIVAIFGKIIFWDYILALKTFFVFQALRASWHKMRQDSASVRVGVFISTGTVITIDLYLTAVLTAGFLRFGELFQREWITGSAMATESGFSVVQMVGEFFDAFNFIIREAVEGAFYILNGSLIMYAALAFSRASQGAFSIFDAESIKRKIFTIIFSLVALTLILISLVRYLAGEM